MNANVLSILGVSSKEDVISNLLRYCIEASREFRDAFLSDICNVPSPSNARVQALTRVSTGESGVPDLVIAVESPSEKHLVVLENKLKADEGKDQTVRYSSRACVDYIKRRVGWSGTTPSERFVFLTLFPDQKPAAAAFRLVTYQDLLDTMRPMLPITDPMALLLTDSWRALLETFYSKARPLDDDFLLAQLQEADPIEGNYLYFKSFIASLSLPDDLSLEYTFRASARGRRFFGAIISKPSWHPAEMQEVDGRWQFDGTRHFNIHFEPQFHYLKGVLELYVHYEINPYHPVKWVRKNIDASAYRAYEVARADFVRELESKRIPNLTIGGGSNQIAKARHTLENETVRGAREAISAFIHEVALNVDAILSAEAKGSVRNESEQNAPPDALEYARG